MSVGVRTEELGVSVGVTRDDCWSDSDEEP